MIRRWWDPPTRTWPGIGHIGSDHLAAATGIMTANPLVRVSLSDSGHPELAGRAGCFNRRDNAIRVAADRPSLTRILAHEIYHSIDENLPVDERDHLAAFVRREVLPLTEWQRLLGWCEEPGEVEACMYAAWRTGTSDAVALDDRIESLFQDIDCGAYALGA